MAALRVAAVAALATVCSAQGPFSLFKLDTGNAFDAVCLDGTPAAFYYSAGSGENADDWCVPADREIALSRIAVACDVHPLPSSSMLSLLYAGSSISRAEVCKR
jgi:hypothetical protein